MSYDMNFKAQFNYDKNKEITKEDCKAFASTMIDELSDNRVYEDSDTEDIIDDFADVLYEGYSDNCSSKMYSDTYFDLSIFIEYAKWLIKEGYTKNNRVKVIFEWDGEEMGDYSIKEIDVELIGDTFKGTTKKLVPKIVDFDLTKQITRR